eukprot:13063576-Heterocapsa_arctica.AAC.1
MCYAATHYNEVLIGTLSTNDLLTAAQLVASPDADLAGDKTTTTSNSGLWLEPRSPDGLQCWPLA